MSNKEYKVITVTESAIGTLFLGASKIPVDKLEEKLNYYATDGWRCVYQIIEKSRYLLFWEREKLIITLER